jgi:hypothetical protein
LIAEAFEDELLARMAGFAVISALVSLAIVMRASK